jgi:hypothetical protein
MAIINNHDRMNSWAYIAIVIILLVLLISLGFPVDLEQLPIYED